MIEENETALPPGEYLRSLEVEDLFGEVNYLLRPIHDDVDPRLTILYGDNGTGKTTILRTLESLVSGKDGAGLRSRLARTVFRRVRVSFRSGLAIEASRKRNLIGGYKWSISRDHDEMAEFNVVARGADYSIRSDSWPTELKARYESFLSLLSSCVGSVELLDDQRTVIPAESNHHIESGFSVDGLSRGFPYPSVRSSADPVQVALESVTESVRREAFARSQRGVADQLTIYSDLVERMTRGGRGGPQEGADLEKTVERLHVLERRMSDFAEYGFSSELDHGEFIGAIRAAPVEKQSSVLEVVQPYVQAVEARLVALDGLMQSTRRWLEILGDFIAAKSVRFSISSGLEIVTRGGKSLTCEALSSGERQIVLMLCRAFARRNLGGMMLIDEPELSLNVKWQRNLVPALQTCLGSSGTQLVLASHALDIAGVALRNVLELKERG